MDVVTCLRNYQITECIGATAAATEGGPGQGCTVTVIDIVGWNLQVIW